MFFNELTSKFSDRFLIAFNESSLAIILGECINSFETVLLYETKDSSCCKSLSNVCILPSSDSVSCTTESKGL